MPKEMHLEGKCFSRVLVACESPRLTEKEILAKKTIEFGLAVFKNTVLYFLAVRLSAKI